MSLITGKNVLKAICSDVESNAKTQYNMYTETRHLNI